MDNRSYKNVSTRTSVDQFDLFAAGTTPSAEACETADHAPTPVAKQADASLIAVMRYVAGSGAEKGRPAKPLRSTTDSSEPRLLDVREAARRLGLSKSTLDKMRCAGTGPRFIRATARAVRYDPVDLDAFASERRRTSTMEDALSAITREN